MLTFSPSNEGEIINIMETNLFLKPVEANITLDGIGVKKEHLVQVVEAMWKEKLSCSPNDTAGAPLILAYHIGIRRLREVLIPNGWRASTNRNLEFVYDGESTYITVWNTDENTALPSPLQPRPIAKKGNATKSVINSNQLSWAEILGPAENCNQLSTQAQNYWVLCVYSDDTSVRAELSLPNSIHNGQFTSFIKRIVIIGEGEWDNNTTDLNSSRYEEDDIPLSIDVSRKQS